MINIKDLACNERKTETEDILFGTIVSIHGMPNTGETWSASVSITRRLHEGSLARFWPHKSHRLWFSQCFDSVLLADDRNQSSIRDVWLEADTNTTI